MFEEQVEDLVDDALQYFQERHFDGVSRVLLKYQVTQEDIDRGIQDHWSLLQTDLELLELPPHPQPPPLWGLNHIHLLENSNYLQVAPDIIGINKVFQYNATLGNGIYNVKYQFMSMTFLVFGVVMVMPVVMILHHIQ